MRFWSWSFNDPGDSTCILEREKKKKKKSWDGVCLVSAKRTKWNKSIGKLFDFSSLILYFFQSAQHFIQNNLNILLVRSFKSITCTNHTQPKSSFIHESLLLSSHGIIKPTKNNFSWNDDTPNYSHCSQYFQSKCKMLCLIMMFLMCLRAQCFRIQDTSVPLRSLR